MSSAKDFEEQHPFTNFGQFGVNVIDLRVFDQDEWWVTLGTGVGVHLTDMEDEKLLEIMSFLFNRAEYFYDMYSTQQMINFVSGHLNRDIPEIEIDLHLYTIDTLAELTPHQWLASTSLVRKINNIMDNR